MEVLALFMLGIGLSMDSLALSITVGLNQTSEKLKTALKVATIFALVQASTPILGWIAGLQFVSFIEEFDHWFAFVVLGFIGSHMIRESLKKSDVQHETPISEKFSLVTLFGMAIATSIDALAVGVTFAFLNINVWLAIAFIGGCTFLISFVGYYIGNSLGGMFKRWALLFGGVILMGLGIKILVEHLFF